MPGFVYHVGTNVSPYVRRDGATQWLCLARLCASSSSFNLRSIYVCTCTYTVDADFKDLGILRQGQR